MEVILLEKIRNLGNLGAKVNVKAGYGRNFLIPQKKAVFATDKNLEMFEERRAELEKKAQQLLSQAEQRSAKLSDVTLELNVQASEEGKLYGSIGPVELEHAFQEKELDVTKREIVLPEGPLHHIGEYVIEVHLHTDVVANVHVHVHQA